MPRATTAIRTSPSALSKTIVVQAVNQQRRKPIDIKRLCAAVRIVLAGERFKRAHISLAVVNDRTIHELNRSYLDHDQPTDVISFSLESKSGMIDGEIVVSADTAAKAAKEFDSTMADELLLYVVHGTLHLAGYDDLTPGKRRIMRKKEQFYLAQLGCRMSK